MNKKIINFVELLQMSHKILIYINIDFLVK